MNWSISCLSDVSEFIRNGASIPQSKEAGGVPITRIESISERVFNPGKCGYADLGEREYLEYRLKLGDIMISHINSEKHLAKCAIFEDDGFDVIHGMNLLCLRPNQEKIFPKFLFHYLSSSKFIQLIPAITKKSVNQASFTVTAFKTLEVPLPPLPEQKRIAAILDKADAIRRKRQQAIQLADDFLRAVFLDMFGDPVTNPMGWRLLPFSAVGTLDRGKSRHRPRNDPALLDGAHPLIQTGEVANSRGYITEYSATYSDLGLAQSKKWDAGTLCITIAANIAKTGILTFPACFPDSVVGFIPNKNATVEFVQHWLGFLQKNLEANAPQAAQKNINLEILRGLLIPVPPIAEQEKFSAVVTSILAVEGKIVSSCCELGNAFDALCQKAFSGHL